jgi:hypothetical protein
MTHSFCDFSEREWTARAARTGSETVMFAVSSHFPAQTGVISRVSSQLSANLFRSMCCERAQGQGVPLYRYGVSLSCGLDMAGFGVSWLTVAFLNVGSCVIQP